MVLRDIEQIQGSKFDPNNPDHRKNMYILWILETSFRCLAEDDVEGAEIFLKILSKYTSPGQAEVLVNWVGVQFEVPQMV